MTTTRSPIAHLVAAAPAPVQGPLCTIRLIWSSSGAKGPRLVEWAEQHALDLPERIYDTQPVGADGVLARAGAGELILECRPEDELSGTSECGRWKLRRTGSIGWSSSL